MKIILLLCAVFAIAQPNLAGQTTVRVEPSSISGPRPLLDQTRESAIRDYLHSWQSLSAALEQNRADLLNSDFVGDAKSTLASTVHQQAALGMRTVYLDRSHDIQIVFYSPEGLSLELKDTVKYDLQVLDHDKIASTQHLRARCIVIMTPAEVRWKVRVLQALPE